MKNPHKYTENQILKMNYQAYIKSPNCHNIVENSGSSNIEMGKKKV